MFWQKVVHTIVVASCLLLAPVASFAARDGEIGTTSRASISISVTIPKLSKITAPASASTTLSSSSETPIQLLSNHGMLATRTFKLSAHSATAQNVTLQMNSIARGMKSIKTLIPLTGDFVTPSTKMASSLIAKKGVFSTLKILQSRGLYTQAKDSNMSEFVSLLIHPE